MPSLQTVLKFATSLFAVAPTSRLIDQNNGRNIAAISWGPNRLDVVGIGSNHALWHQGWNNPSNISGGTGWQDVGGYSNAPPAIISPLPGFLFVFLLSPDGILQWKYYDRTSWYPSERGYNSFDGSFSGPPAAVSSYSSIADFTGDLFARHVNNSYLHNPLRINRGFIGWENLGGDFVSEPAAAAWGPRRLDVFGLGTDGSYLWKYWSGTTWSSRWESLGGSFRSPPVVVSKGLGQLTIFGISENFTLLLKHFQHGAWSDTWEDLEGSLTSNVAVQVSTISGIQRFDIFGVNDEYQLVHKAWNGSYWTPWVKHCVGILNSPTVARWTPNGFDVFGLNYRGKVLHQGWTKDGWSPEHHHADNLVGKFINFD